MVSEPRNERTVTFLSKGDSELAYEQLLSILDADLDEDERPAPDSPPPG
jgi:hypothetical protein